MADRPLRFVHAGEFHLERPACGMAEVPDVLRETFLESPYRAAARVFEAVLAEEADFLVLSGDVLDPGLTGPRGPLFLAEQFARLGERGIAVYWAGGRIDPPDAWPAAAPLPPNVHPFVRGRLESFLHQRDGEPIARVTGASHDPHRPIRPGEFDPPAPGLCTIGVGYGLAEPSAGQTPGVSYWALGGRHDRLSLFSAPQVAHYCGSPQGRSSEEWGAHGCTLVHVDAHSAVRTALLPTDVLRWFSEQAAVEEATTAAGLETLLRERTAAIAEAAPGIDRVVSWTIGGTGPLVEMLRRGGLAEELLGRLRQEFAAAHPAVWIAQIEIESPALPAAWYEQDSIGGDLLRAIRQYEMNPERPIDLSDCLCEAHRCGTLASLVAIEEPESRQRVLREAGLLGADLLGGE